MSADRGTGDLRRARTCPNKSNPSNAAAGDSVPNSDELRVIGRSRRRVDARGKVTGRDGLRRRHLSSEDGSLQAAPLSASSCSNSKDQCIPRPRTSGRVFGVTGKDLPIEYGILPVSQDETALCVDHVRHVGDPVAAVIAREELTASEAIDLIDVDYEILRTISDPEEGLSDTGAADSRLR